MGRNMVFTLLGIVAVVGLLGGAKAWQIRDLISTASVMMPPPTAVSTVLVQSQDWEKTLSSVGSLEAVQGVLISADIPGRITQIFFEPGAEVKAGDKILQQDVSSELAQLRAAEATVELAEASLTRVKELLSKRVSSQSEMDTAQARYKEAVAQADNVRALIAKKTISAPFDGRLGIRLVNLGQDLASGAPIVSLQAVDPMFVNVTLPQRDLQYLQLGLPVRVKTDALPGQQLAGRITALDPKINPATRTVQVQATLENPHRHLLPGMFTEVAVVLPATDAVLTVPATAVAYATYGDSVFVVEESDNPQTGEKQWTAQQHFVQLGNAQGDFVTISKGLQVNQTVVSAGVFKLRNGASVAIKNDVQPDFQLTPNPRDE